jgi:uncharacterized protein YyaL (SSP411 family)
MWSRLLAIRNKRIRPHLDDKVLTDWNGLMIAAFASASRVLKKPEYLAAAVKAAEFIEKNLRDERGRLLHRWRDKEAAIAANLNDYAFLIHGYLELYQAGFDERWLSDAKALADEMIGRFWDKKDGGFYLTADDAEALIARPKEIYDGAIPSGNSFAALDLFLLERFTMEPSYKKYGEETLRAFGPALSAEPANYPQMLTALDFTAGPSTEIVLAGDAGDPGLLAMRREIDSFFLPNKIVVFHASGERGRAIEALSPFLKNQKAVRGKVTAYVCRNFTCELPVTDARALKALLAKENWN